MSARETALQYVSLLDEKTAQQLLGWLNEHKPSSPATQGLPAPSAVEMIGFANRYHAQPRITAEWMADLRGDEGDEGDEA